MQAASSFYSEVAILVLCLHVLFILWVVFGALLTRSRPVLRGSFWLNLSPTSLASIVSQNCTTNE
jgi:hypothetical protein